MHTEVAHTDVRAELLAAWVRSSSDPDVHVPAWLAQGTPAGIRAHPESCGIFPCAGEDEDELNDPELLETQHDTFASYASVEADSFAWDEVQKIVGQGWMKEFDSLRDCTEFLGGETPVLSKFGMVVKMRGTKIKRRLSLDSKQSGIRYCATKRERVLLPRVTDAMFDMPDMAANAREGDFLEWLVLDFADVFWNLPLLGWVSCTMVPVASRRLG